MSKKNLFNLYITKKIHRSNYFLQLCLSLINIFTISICTYQFYSSAQTCDKLVVAINIPKCLVCIQRTPWYVTLIHVRVGGHTKKHKFATRSINAKDVLFAKESIYVLYLRKNDKRWCEFLFESMKIVCSYWHCSKLIDQIPIHNLPQSRLEILEFTCLRLNSRDCKQRASWRNPREDSRGYIEQTVNHGYGSHAE